MSITLRASRFVGSFGLVASVSAVMVGALFTSGCSSADAGADGQDNAATNPATSPSNETHIDSTSVSTIIYSHYGMTTFGGPGDYQAMACGENSRTSQPYYVASSQRYGCNVHLQLTTAAGKCIVVQTEDIGPALFVETDAKQPILDSSPVVSEYLFGESELGWSDNEGTTRYDVTAVETTAALGPCNGTAPAPVSGSDAGTGTGTASSCHSDGDCNTGNDGSGKICVSGSCVAGCNANWECPGDTTCKSGQCE